ncbi:PREDICTED: beta-D-glucosyl crocetin beta-1,6-glucosyltransferase-like [Ipomoea nil]|uniref:beta-D-glucosyl crocetin beta-1,6-glucosyltransferase-like n=1 Tax=Ipomoea nil TaxID=35883 RepID=UPI000900E2BD|nr:PREDICTED: beta-D-glucosyl crocetin beta-1,6-glucosyltransferase-like [Ipomoea nil]
MVSLERRPNVLMFPWLAYGHIVPFVGLAKKLSDKGFIVHICSTEINLVSIKKMIPENYSNSITLTKLLLPAADFPELPPHYHTANGLPSHLYGTLRDAFRKSKPYFANVMKTLAPNLLIYDYMNLWAEGIAHSLDIPAVRFYISSAASFSFFSHFVRNAPGVAFPFPAVYFKPHELSLMHEMKGNVKGDEKDPDENWTAPQKAVLVSTSSEIEAKYIGYMSELINCKVVPVPVASIVEVPGGGDDDAEILDWLGKKSERSTVLVSFGSEYFLSEEEIAEIAHGLELSNVNFIWVLRFRKGEELTAEKALPHGYLDRVKEKGRVIEGWAPQAKILNHPSIGGFVSQCGWNSALESINFGVPIIALPGFLEQPLNARCLVDKGVAVEIERDNGGKLRGEELARVVGEVMGAGKRGETLKRNMKKTSEDLKLMREEEIDAAVQELEKLCN